MSYLIDTDIASNPLKKLPSLTLVRKLAATEPHEQHLSTISVGELIYGARKSAKAAALMPRLQQEVLPNYQIVPFDFAAAEEYGRLRVELEAAGTPLADPDLRIASIALSRGLTLVTGNLRHFQRVPGLVVENWLIESDAREGGNG
jgi:tRNA(fMet)-specific endonuclease VapC